MSRILVASYDMEVGGVERSLASMLDHFDYGRYDVEIMLFRHQGDFMDLLPAQARLLEERKAYASFRRSIGELVRERQYPLALSRLASKLHAGLIGKAKGIAEPGYRQMQLMWRYARPLLPRMEGEYDAAISYLWPHDFVAYKVKAAVKLAWIHTDYSTIETDEALDLVVWSRFDHIVAVSDACRDAFLRKYPVLRDKVAVIENITSPALIRSLANEPVPDPMAADKRFKLVTVARLSHAKGIDNAVRALRLLKDRGFPDIAWYVVGYGGDEDAIRALIGELGLEDSFILLGKQMNPYPYIRSGDLYVQPSRYEGKAVTVTEAKVLGRPVLITDYATATSQVAHGEDGWISALSAAGIADGIERLYRDEELRCRLAAACGNTEYGNSAELAKLYDRIDKVQAEGGASRAV